MDCMRALVPVSLKSVKDGADQGWGCVQCYNAIKRLSASYVDQSDLDIGAGGAASFTDVCRVLWGVSMAVQGSEANIPQGGYPICC